MFRSPSKSKKSKSFKFPSKKEKREKSREKDAKEKEKEVEKEKKKEKEGKVRLKLKERKKSKHMDDSIEVAGKLQVAGCLSFWNYICFKIFHHHYYKPHMLHSPRINGYQGMKHYPQHTVTSSMII